MSNFLEDMQKYSKVYNLFIKVRNRCCVHSGPGYNPGIDYIWNSRYLDRVNGSIRKIEFLINELCLSEEVPNDAKCNLYLVLQECNNMIKSLNQVR